MSAQTISLRLPEEEVAILNLLSDRERRTKTQIIREALQPLFRKVLDEPERITLSNTEFQALLDVNFQRFPTLDAKKLVNAPKMSAHHRGICHF